MSKPSTSKPTAFETIEMNSSSLPSSPPPTYDALHTMVHVDHPDTSVWQDEKGFPKYNFSRPFPPPTSSTFHSHSQSPLPHPNSFPTTFPILPDASDPSHPLYATSAPIGTALPPRPQRPWYRRLQLRRKWAMYLLLAFLILITLSYITVFTIRRQHTSEDLAPSPSPSPSPAPSSSSRITSSSAASVTGDAATVSRSMTTVVNTQLGTPSSSPTPSLKPSSSMPPTEPDIGGGTNTAVPHDKNDNQRKEGGNGGAGMGW